MTDRIVLLTPQLIELGEFIQKHVQDGYTLMDAYPRQHGFQYEVIVEKAEQETEASDKPAPKPKGRPAKAAEDK